MGTKAFVEFEFISCSQSLQVDLNKWNRVSSVFSLLTSSEIILRSNYFAPI